MKKPFYWVKTAICKIKVESCEDFEDIPIGVKGKSPYCPNCPSYKAWVEANYEAELRNREINKAAQTIKKERLGGGGIL